MSQSRNSWIPEVSSNQEDEIIKEIVIEQGQKKWTKIAKVIEERLGVVGRTGKQCRERWHNHLNPDVIKESWTAEEESKIFELQKQLGNRWSEIAAHLPGRTDNSIKNCFYSAIRRNLRKYNKKRPECEKLKGPVKNLLKKPANRAFLMRDSFSETEKIVKKEKKVNEIVVPVIKPTPLSIFQFPGTPSTAHSLDSSQLGSGFFYFPEEIGGSFLLDEGSEGVKTEVGARKCFVPQFTPKGSFQFYFTPRNSN